MFLTLFWFSAAAIIHHHIIYPLSLRLLPRKPDPAPLTAGLRRWGLPGRSGGRWRGSLASPDCGRMLIACLGGGILEIE